jgi:hypothetical protein
MRPCLFKSHVIVSNSRQRRMTKYSPCLFLKMNPNVLLNGCHWIPAENIKLKFNPSTPTPGQEDHLYGRLSHP